MILFSHIEKDLEKNILKASKAVNNKNIHLVQKLISIIDPILNLLEDNNFKFYSFSNFGGVLIDYGLDTSNQVFIYKGINYCYRSIDYFSIEKIKINFLYNLLKGYSSLTELYLKSINNEVKKIKELPIDYLFEKTKYREVIDLLKKRNKLDDNELKILPDLFTNYANMLDTFGRSLEAIEYYDKALELNPNFPMALLNKSITLKKLAFLSPKYTHNIMFEIKELLERAIPFADDFYFKDILDKEIDEINHIINSHSDGFNVQKIKNSKPKNKFHSFLREYCYKHNLFLNSITFIKNEDSYLFDDSLFFSKMWAKVEDNKKFDKYITFFNQIKQDYIFSRYLLVQSQYQSSYADIIDKDVKYLYPLDFSSNCSYFEMLKISYRLALDTLDKISYFIRDYSNVKIQKDKVTFRNIFSEKENKIEVKNELKSFNNIYILSFLDMSIDYGGNNNNIGQGYYKKFLKNRNLITHRYLTIHYDYLTLHNKPIEIDRILVDDFIIETIKVLKFVKAAIFNLVLFVDNEEYKNNYGKKSIDIEQFEENDFFRWKPENGEFNEDK